MRTSASMFRRVVSGTSRHDRATAPNHISCSVCPCAGTSSTELLLKTPFAAFFAPSTMTSRSASVR